MTVSVCVEGPARGGVSPAERQCLPDAAVYVLGAFVLVALLCTMLAAARFTRDWLKLRLLAKQGREVARTATLHPSPSEVMTLDQFAEHRRKTNWMAWTK